MSDQPNTPYFPQADPTTPDPTTPDPTTPDPTTPAPAPAPEPTPAPEQPVPSAQVGDVVTFQLDEDAPQVRALVVGTVEGAEHRDEGLVVVPLPDAVVVPRDALIED